MLNLTQMFSLKPPQPVGGRLVKGYAMSGSKCNAVCSEAIQANKAHKQKAINDQSVLSVMKPDYVYSMAQLVSLSGVSKTSCRAAVDRLLEAGSIKSMSGVNCRFFMLA